MIKKEPTTLELLGNIAKILDSDEFADSTSRAQRRIFRDTADKLRDSLEEWAPLTPPMLLCFWAGAYAEAQVQQHVNPVSAILGTVLGQGANDAGSPHFTLNISVAYLARDLLADMRVEE